MLKLSRKDKNYSLQLKFIENYISTGKDNYVVLAGLRDYYHFVTDEDDDNKLRQYLFEANVRDFQGEKVEVNKDIQETLKSEKKEIDFWWLNNGITILASNANVVGKAINLDNVQIVNGLQTTNTIYYYLKSLELDGSKTDSDPIILQSQNERSILIKIIVTSDLETRDSIIKATNFQTPVPPAQLRATESIQRNIEDYFLQHNWFYDRRKNYYKNIGKTPDRIISILYLSQAFTAIVRQEPHISKGRPTTIIKENANYARVFNDSIEIEVYLNCCKIIKVLEAFIRSSDFTKLKEDTKHPYLDVANFKILKYHFSLLFTIKLLHKKDYGVQDIESLVDDFDKSIFRQEAAIEIAGLTSKYMIQNGSESVNTIAKSKDFVAFLLENVNP